MCHTGSPLSASLIRTSMPYSLHVGKHRSVLTDCTVKLSPLVPSIPPLLQGPDSLEWGRLLCDCVARARKLPRRGPLETTKSGEGAGGARSSRGKEEYCRCGFCCGSAGTEAEGVRTVDRRKGCRRCSFCAAAAACCGGQPTTGHDDEPISIAGGGCVVVGSLLALAWCYG